MKLPRFLGLYANIPAFKFLGGSAGAPWQRFGTFSALFAALATPYTPLFR